MKHAQQIRQHVGRGEVAWGTFLVELEATGVVRILANCGLDFFILDGEHGTYNVDRMRQLIEAANAAGIACLARTPLGDRGTVTKLLDAGADGILFPQVRTLDDVHQAVRLTKYPPLGWRGVHLLRPHTGFSPPADQTAFFREANAALITAVQIETPEAVELVESIAAIEGVDMLYAGPGDLSANLGLSGSDDHPQIAQAMNRVAHACAAHGKIAGCHVGRVESAAARIEQGFRVIGCAADARFFLEAMRTFVERAHQIAPREDARP